MSSEFVRGLKCRLCGKLYPKEALNFCTEDFGPLEVDYDYEAIGRSLSREAVERRHRTMWRYKELLPIDGEPTVGLQVGCTPLVKATRLAEALGVRELYIKNDAVNYPTLSFKDRVVAVALSKAVELGFDTVGCASTGNLAGSVAANAAAAGLEAYVLIPDDLEQGKVLGATIYGAKVVAISGNYDKVNRLCSQIAFRFGWGFVNVNLRPFYAEGSKSMGFEIAEDLGWRAPDHVVAPMAGGSLIGKLYKAFKELEGLGWIDPVRTRMFGAQATGCNPITNTIKTDAPRVKPVRDPRTIAKSLAIGDPADGFFASKLMKETGGWGEDVDDEAIVDAMKLLAETEGIWAETAGGVTLAVTKKLIEQGKIDRDGTTVVCITGNGLKTQEAVIDRIARPPVINPTLAEFETLIGTSAPAEAELAPAGA
ncbi:threonine synthase [Tautonia plasticadhaerens]|uniref:Threonine synthase n=1 Tax=Tautonia plasticadhaerens TaxID=2527974 RepID=A0A518HBV9_9BACT|nr:threonine synthase [Tautonia plasticadhaerens]QDV38176.1 Threonine synthase [Tautonia plasticadhaerens]